MRQPLHFTTSTLRFRCAPESVWQVITCAENYREWYGHPKTLDCAFVDPAFSSGARLAFKNSKVSKVVTEYELNRVLALANEISREEIVIEPSPEGCNVTLNISVYAGPGDGTAAEAMLKALKVYVYDKADDIGEPRHAAEPAKQPAGDSNMLPRVLRGYKRPIIGGRRSEDEARYAQFIDNTEADVTLPRRSALIAVLFAVMLFVALGVALRFERGDIVPSSGLSLTESPMVNRDSAMAVDFEMNKKSLELLLSCQGLRVTSEKYFYCSTERDPNGESLEQMYVVYDAYGNIRKYAYINLAESAKRLSGEIGQLGGDYAGVFGDINNYLSPSMTIGEVEQIVGRSASAFVVDKSGLVTIFFGRLDTEADVFSNVTTAEIVVKLNRTLNTTSVNYYFAYNPLNTFPNEVTKQLKRQYSREQEFYYDLFAFERTFLLVGATREQTDIVLRTEGVEQVADNGSGYSEVRYSAKNTAVDEAMYRYEYVITYEDGAAASVTMTNQKIKENINNALADFDSAVLYEGMPLYEAYGAIGYMPAAVTIDQEAITLYYGTVLQPGTRRETYELVVEFSANNNRLTAYAFEQ